MPPPRPPVSPGVPPQLVGCGAGRDFYRITHEALEVFEVSKTIPPPQVRGSSAAVQTAAIPIAEPLTLVPTPPRGVLVIAKQNVFRYEPGDKRARPSAPIPTSGPVMAWADPRPSSLWVRVLGEKGLHQYPLTGTSKAREHALRDFDARLFTVLSDGAPFYSTPRGFRRLGDAEQVAATPKPPEPAMLLFPDVAPERYWTADAQGNLGLWDLKQPDSPVLSARVPGAVIDVALEGARVAVLSIEAVDQSYRPTVTIFSEGKQQAQRRVSGTPASGGQPAIDLCLIPGRPWVVVGGTRWMQLVDWETPRLLSEW